MRASIHNLGYAFLALAMAGCAGATAAAPQMQIAPVVRSRPAQIVVFPFSTDAADVTLNQGIGARIYRNYSGQDQTASQAQLARSTARSICVEVATSLASKGWNAACQPRGAPVSGGNVLIVDGDFTDLSEGNRVQQMVIGMGLGASKLNTSAGLYQYSSGASNQLLTFSTHADSGKMPGVGITGPAGAAAGGAAAATIGVNDAAPGVKHVTSSTSYLGDQTANQIVDQLNNYFSQQGWIAPGPNT